MPRSVSNTPTPCDASAEKAGALRKLSGVIDRRHVQDHVAGRFCLLYWRTSGTARASNAMFTEVRVQVLEGLNVLVELSRLTVGNEHDPVSALQREFARRLVV